MDEDDAGHEGALGIMGSCACTMLVLAIGILLILTPKMRKTFFVRMTCKMHFLMHTWYSLVYFDYGDTMDDHRANALNTYIEAYWCEEEVKAWLAERWAVWVEQAVSWVSSFCCASVT